MNFFTNIALHRCENTSLPIYKSTFDYSNGIWMHKFDGYGHNVLYNGGNFHFHQQLSPCSFLKFLCSCSPSTSNVFWPSAGRATFWGLPLYHMHITTSVVHDYLHVTPLNGAFFRTETVSSFFFISWFLANFLAHSNYQKIKTMFDKHVKDEGNFILRAHVYTTGELYKESRNHFFSLQIIRFHSNFLKL